MFLTLSFSKSLKLSAVCLLLAFATTLSAELDCTFLLHPFGRYDYECVGYTEVSSSDNIILNVTGDHKHGFGNGDVLSIEIFNSSLVNEMPKNLKDWFQNFVQFKLYDLPNFPEFNAGDFNELRHLKSFVTSNLPQITQIPKDSFKDLTQLQVLGLNEMPNLGNLDADLLMYATSLEIFSARGPNKIDQISPGFFRNQVETLQAVDFTNTKLLKISYNVFEKFQVLTDAFFRNAGCLNVSYYFGDVKESLSQEIRSKCLNFENQNSPQISSQNFNKSSNKVVS